MREILSGMCEHVIYCEPNTVYMAMNFREWERIEEEEEIEKNADKYIILDLCAHENSLPLDNDRTFQFDISYEKLRVIFSLHLNCSFKLFGGLFPDSNRFSLIWNHFPDNTTESCSFSLNSLTNQYGQSSWLKKHKCELRMVKINVNKQEKTIGLWGVRHTLCVSSSKLANP